MRWLRRFPVILCLLTLTLSNRVYAEGLSLSSPSVLLMEKETGTVLYAQEEHVQREPASVTKVMTLLLTMEAIDAGTLSYDDEVTGSAHAASMGGSQIWLKEGERMSVHDLLKAVCVVSGNDAAVALGEKIAGSEELFVERMNQRAEELGMHDTHFVNCTGLPAEGHVTSAYDIALMSRELIRNHPDIRQFTTIWMDSLRGGTSLLVNTNKLVRFYEGATGLKTGSTGAAGYCISATAERNGMELIAVVMRGKTSDARFADARAMLDYGFATYELITVMPDEALTPLRVSLGERDAVQPLLSRDNRLLLEKTVVSGLQKAVTLPESVPAPVNEGDRLGELRLTDAAGKTIAVLPILAGESVAHITWGQMFGRVLRMAFCAE